MVEGVYVHAYIGPLIYRCDARSPRISLSFSSTIRERERESEAMGKKQGGGGNGGNAGGGGDQNGGKPIKGELMNEGENKEPKKKGGGVCGGGSLTIVLKVDMHCEGCSKKVKDSLKGTLGIEEVTADIGSNKLTVIGKVDPIMIRDRVQSKTHKKVELISPVPKKNQDENKKEDKKPKEHPVSTVVLKIALHCEGCTQRIRKKITRVKGVYSVAVDNEKDQVSVRGIMDVKTLPAILKEKLKRAVDIVPPKKEKGGEKKEKEEGEGGDKKENGGNKKKDGGEGKKAECCCGDHGSSTYYMEMVHAPQLFSDENPNSCSVM